MTIATLPRTTKVSSRLLGDITVAHESLVTFPRGLLGFPEQRRYALVSSEREGLFWLQSVDSPALTFLLADPFTFFPQYTVDVPDADVASIDATSPGDVLLLAIVTVGGKSTPATANLQGPVIINPHTQLGRQIAVAESEAAVRTRIELGTAD